MNLISQPTLNFRSNQYNKYFDNPMDFEEEYKIIPEYEELDEPVQDIEESTYNHNIFRNNELFDRRVDYVDFNYRRYDIDDVELSNTIRKRHLPSDQRHFSRYIEGGRTEDDVLRDYQRRSFVLNTYTVDNAWAKEHESVQERLNQGYKKEDIVQIYHSALVSNGSSKYMDFKLTKAGFEILNSGKSINETTKIMEGSKISYADGSTRFNKELMDFLIACPDCRHHVVAKKNDYEYLRKDVINVYPDIVEVCPKEEDITSVLETCQIDDEKNKYLDKTLLDICLATVKNGVPAKVVTSAIRQSKLMKGDKSEFDKSLFDFLIKNPNTRDLAVDSSGSSERIRHDVISIYPKIKDVCDDKKDIKEIIKTCQSGHVSRKVLDEYFVDICLEKIKNGESVEDATFDISQAKIIHENHSTELNKDLYYFLEKYPDAREDVVQKYYRTEEYKPDRVKVYPKVYDACENKEHIKYVLKSSELTTNYKSHIDKNLLGLSLNLLAKEPYWDNRHNTILSRVKTNSGKSNTTINSKKFELADTMAKGHYSLDSIYSIVVLNNKNVELCE